MDNPLARRIRRIYAAVAETIETDMDQLPAYVVSTERIRGFFQDFSGGDTPEQLENTLQSLIAMVASFEYHLRRWADHNGHDPQKVTDTFSRSRPLQIIHDLWDSEKHGYPRRHGQDRSRVPPQLEHVRRVMEMRTQAKKGSFVGMTIGPGGVPVILGDGTAQAVITGEINDADGNAIGDAHTMLVEALDVCETLLREFRVELSDT